MITWHSVHLKESISIKFPAKHPASTGVGCFDFGMIYLFMKTQENYRRKKRISKALLRVVMLIGFAVIALMLYLMDR